MTSSEMGPLREGDLEEISNMLQSINDSGFGITPSKSVMGAHAALAVASAGMDMARNDNDEYERWLRIKLNLDENLTLKEENQKLKERLETVEKYLRQNVVGEIQPSNKTLKSAENELKEKNKEILNLEDELNLEKLKITTQQRELNEIKSFMKKLYTAAGNVLEELGGNVLPFREIDEGEQFRQIIEEFCQDLQTKFSEWQGNHLLMHNELAKTLTMVEGFVEQYGDGKKANDEDIEFVNLDSDMDEDFDFEVRRSPPPKRALPSSSSPTSLSQLTLENDAKLALRLSRQNPLRKCRLPINSYEGNHACWDHLSENSQFACEHCGDVFCRLAHVHSQLAILQNESPKQGSVEAERKIKRKYAKRRKMNGDLSGYIRRKKPRINKNINNFEEEPDLNDQRLKLVMTESTGEEHTFVGIKMVKLTPEESCNGELEMISPTEKRRYFCKCGRNYAALTNFYQHLKSIENGNSIQCEFCDQEFQIHNALKAHMRNAHGKDYVQKRFPCLECEKRFSTKNALETHREFEHGNPE